MRPLDQAIDAIVQALEEIKPGISKDERSLKASLAFLEPPKRTGAPARADEMTRFALALEAGKISPASWLMIAMEAHNQGYYLPSNRDTMARIAKESAARIKRTRRTCAWRGQHVALACATLYLELTRTLPKILNYRQLGCYNDYARLVKAAFDVRGLSGWGWAAQNAASELKHAVEYKKDL